MIYEFLHIILLNTLSFELLITDFLTLWHKVDLKILRILSIFTFLTLFFDNIYHKINFKIYSTDLINDTLGAGSGMLHNIRGNRIYYRTTVSSVEEAMA